MINHFEWKSLYETEKIPGWKFSFYFEKKRYKGVYHKDGSITWIETQPSDYAKAELESRVHELMLYHVYDNQ
ncbi:hypothetical protein F7984_04025 [Pradoshia sp. D12]|uniref:YheE family protein n=1 Tax=Bacillaceae TaxID=186817 RepID=UPI00080AFA05|nr:MULTISPECIES: YheE family protein [Bacillaceae]OCA90126.1 hypothetical protein A8L44_04165 [Bacillus sp. FJAT-27986]QFK70468.1 hypothetical protein F7984_04025 [Pradoshia sp. D12]TPF72263.1 hypothetical protein FHY44_00420 [Bacillus sp. D12]